MAKRNLPKKRVNVGGHIFEELAFKHISEKFGVSKEDIITLARRQKVIQKSSLKTSPIIPAPSTSVSLSSDISGSIESFPLFILRSAKLSSLESIVKFLREVHGLSYKDIGSLVCRNFKTLAVTYAIAKRKMPEPFATAVISQDPDQGLAISKIPFDAFSKDLSVLECICHYLNSHGKSFVEISRLLDLDQRTVWTVCSRAKKKLSKSGSSIKLLSDVTGKKSTGIKKVPDRDNG